MNATAPFRGVFFITLTVSEITKGSRQYCEEDCASEVLRMLAYEANS